MLLKSYIINFITGTLKNLAEILINFIVVILVLCSDFSKNFLFRYVVAAYFTVIKLFLLGLDIIACFALRLLVAQLTNFPR